jgi:glycosyltransferase involved in cell wall biosynthesis
MERHVRTVAPNASITTLEYGADLQLADDVTEDQRSTLRQKCALDRRDLILYAGTFGRANAIPTLLDAAKQLADRSDLLFAFAGRGYYDSAVQQAADQHDHIRVVDPLPYPDTLALFSLADVSLVSFLDRPVLAANSPSKLYDSLATGTPVVVTNPGWTKQLVERHACGWYVPPESPTRLARRLRRLLDTPDRLEEAGRNARTVARQQFDRAELMDQYASLVDNVKGST